MIKMMKMILILHISRESIYAPPPSSSHQAHHHWGTSPSPSEGKIAAGSLKTTTEAEVFLHHTDRLFTFHHRFKYLVLPSGLRMPLMVILKKNCVMEISLGKPMLVIDKLTAIVIMMAR